MVRQQKIARSIVYAILENNGAKARSLLARILTAIAYFFALYQLSLTKHRNDLFEKLREQWQVDDEDYKDSFGQRNGLLAKGDMGFSGSVSHMPTPYKQQAKQCADLLHDRRRSISGEECPSRVRAFVFP